MDADLPPPHAESSTDEPDAASSWATGTSGYTSAMISHNLNSTGRDPSSSDQISSRIVCISQVIFNLDLSI